MDIGNIEIFAALNEDKLKVVESLFEKRTYSAGDEILRYGEDVDGLYLVGSGSVEVFIPEYDGALATLGEGHTFGELSLFQPDDKASATVKVASGSAEFLYCQKESLVDALAKDPELAAGFYHGTAQMMAARLKSTNNKISGDIAQAINTATNLVDEITSSRKLGVAQSDINAAGMSIVSGMTDIVKKLLVMKQSEEPIAPEDIARLAETAKDIYYSEFQVFDRISQQMQLLSRHLDNVKRILNQQEPEEIS